MVTKTLNSTLCCTARVALEVLIRCFASSIDVWAGNTPGKAIDAANNAIKKNKKWRFMINSIFCKYNHYIPLKQENPDEEPIYTFAGQKDGNPLSIFNTCVVCLTNKRIIIGQDSIVVDYTLNSITPELFNDMQVYSGVLFGKVTIDTIKETIEISNLDKRSLAEIESSVTSFMLAEKKKFAHYR